MNRCFATNPTTLPAFVRIKLTIDPIKPGNALADFDANSFNQSPNVSNAFLIFDFAGCDGGLSGCDSGLSGMFPRG